MAPLNFYRYLVLDSTVIPLVDSQAQREVVNGDWWLVTDGVPPGSVFGAVLFDITTNNLDEWMECTPSKCADNPLLEGREAL